MLLELVAGKEPDQHFSIEEQTVVTSAKLFNTIRHVRSHQNITWAACHNARDRSAPSGCHPGNPGPTGHLLLVLLHALLLPLPLSLSPPAIQRCHSHPAMSISSSRWGGAWYMEGVRAGPFTCMVFSPDLAGWGYCSSPRMLLRCLLGFGLDALLLCVLALVEKHQVSNGVGES